MDNIHQLIFRLLVALSLSACDSTESTKTLSDAVNSNAPPQEVSLNLGERETRQSNIEPKKKRPKAAFKTVEWTDLMPKENLEALLNPPSYVTDIKDGSAEDQISSQIQNTNAAASDDRYQQALVSTRVVSEISGQAIRIPGFIVPLEFDDEQTITQFFLVPFFGACIHVPPPPPNQVIFVDYPEGLKLEALYDPFWVSGVVKTSLIKNELATAAYTLKMQFFEAYTE
ncbi:MAG: DUF3299 domain-containing protein [Gammaproteobacteria bacterium]|nr:DUF3299 domain-containing protein [Gammaproteobacteria bacterium]